MKKNIFTIIIFCVTIPMFCSSTARPDNHQPRPPESHGDPWFVASPQYAHLVGELCRKHDVPLWLACRLITAESTDWNPRAVSPRNKDGSRDLGMMQINDGNLVDFANWYRHGKKFNPFSAMDNMDVGLAHLAWLYSEFGNWTDVVIAYNGGERRVRQRNARPSTIAYAKVVMGSEYEERQK